MLIAGDIGGTKTILAAYSSETSPQKPIVQKQYPSDQYPSLGAMVREFLDDTRLPIHYACFAVAGPVINGRATLTNLPWKSIDEEELSQQLNLTSTRLMNDLEAVANSIPHLHINDLYTLNKGKATPNGAIGVIAPGTGLGEAYMTWDGLEYRAHASEGGHASFAPNSRTELKILAYLWDQHDHVSTERVCSGIGIPSIYQYFLANGYPESPTFKKRLDQAEEQHRTKVIVDEAMQEHPDPLCAQTIQTFAAILGGAAGNLALTELATGGIYIAGGIPMHILPYLNSKTFINAFQAKGRLQNILADIPVHVILARAALLGAAGYGLKLIYRGMKGS